MDTNNSASIENNNVASSDSVNILVPKVENLEGVVLDPVIKDISSDEGIEKSFPDYHVKIIEGEDNGKIVTVYSGGINFESGDRVYIQKTREHDGSEYYVLGEAVRYNSILIALALFVGVVVLAFGKTGLRSLLSLLLSLMIILFVLLPLTLKGYNPVLVAGIVSALLLSFVTLITHGRNRVSYSALLGCLSSVVITIILSYLFITEAKISGFIDETSTYLFYSTGGEINFTLLVIASIIIGVIGVVDDAAITQASSVMQLKKANPNLSKREYYKRAMKIGESHAGAMVNTLVLAYIGSALPVALLFYTTDMSPLFIANKELVATEIFRMLIGSIGLLLAIPLTTLIATYFVSSDSTSLHEGHTH
ncbi:MAG: hypothetical protein QG614_479 [Patescibacteria group bacterium]|nr:hypothetical protein [Patescibacteria group bacterium]